MNALISVNELLKCIKEQLNSISAFFYIILILYKELLIKAFYSKLVLSYIMLAFSKGKYLKS
jgi:hypothetical protein